MEELINKLREHIMYETIADSHIYEKHIFAIYNVILNSWVKEYKLYRENVSSVLYTFEKYSDKSISYSLSIYKNNFYEVLNYPIKGKFNYETIKIKPTEKAIENLEKVLEKTDKQKLNTQIRISDFKIDFEGLSVDEQKHIISALVDKIENDTHQYVWDLNQVETTVFELACLRAFCIHIKEFDIFYRIVNLVFDRLFTNEFHQEARDLGEEILIASFKDGLAVYGFFTLFKIYSNEASIHAALLYGNLFLKSIIQDKSISTDKFKFDILWQTFKFFRNCGLYPFAIELYEKMPEDLSLSDYERHSIDNVYFNCRMLMKDNTLPTSFCDYLNKEREKILVQGIKGCVPWLMIIYNIQRLTIIFKYENSGLEYYLKLFESIVPSDLIQKQKNIIFGNTIELKKQLKESLLKLNRTRNQADFVYDNEMALKISNRLIETSFDEKDVEAVLLAMLVKSDYSINFIERRSIDVAPIKIEEISHLEFYKTYDNPAETLKGFKLEEIDAVIWLISSEEKLFQLTHSNTDYLFNGFKEWDSVEFQKWSRNKVPNLEFDTSTKDRYGAVRGSVIEDYEAQAIEIIKDIAFPKLFHCKGLKRILLVKDMGLSELPHNLLLNEENELVGLTSSVTNILSVEWLKQKLNSPKEEIPNQKSIYIPTEGGDLTINMLFESIRETLEKNSVCIFKSLTNLSPIKSAINIVSSHGNRDISSTHVLYPNDEKVIYNLNGVLGEGKILILLVCHSGSAKEFFFRNEIASLTKKYLSDGYEAVIAPYWSLHINIPPIWLPVFFESINRGDAVSDAVFVANKKVYESFPTPAAWLCMHLYGNPFFHIPTT